MHECNCNHTWRIQWQTKLTDQPRRIKSVSPNQNSDETAAIILPETSHLKYHLALSTASTQRFVALQSISVANDTVNG